MKADGPGFGKLQTYRRRHKHEQICKSSKRYRLVLTRVFDAPRELMFRAWTDPKHLAQWFGPNGFTNPVCEVDLRPGGVWRHVMRGRTATTIR